MTKKFTYCGICLAACGMEVEVENNQIAALRGDSQHPLSRGFLCKKGAACREMTTDPLRILHPYKREGCDWSRISWDAAYGEIAQKLGEIISEHGPNSVAMYSGAGTATSCVKPVVEGAFLEDQLGSHRMFNVLTLEFTNRYLVLEAMYGHQSRVTQPDLEQTQCLLIFGSNPLVSLDHPGIVPSLENLKKRGAKLIVVDPRTSETARLADIHADVIPGTDLFMLLAMYSHIYENGWYDPQFLGEHCVNQEALQNLEKLAPEAAEKICGVPADKIRQIAEAFATSESACAVAKLDLLVSIDFYMNETSQKADYVLPAANFFEKDDIYVSFPDHFPYPFVQWSGKVVDPPGEAKAEWEVFNGLSRRMKQEPEGEDFFDPKKFFGMALGALSTVSLEELMEHPHGLKLGNIEFGEALKKISTPSGKLDVAPQEFVAELQKVGPPEKNPERFPLLLLTGERTPHTKTTNYRSVERLLARQSGTFLRINQQDADALSISDGDVVEVSTRSGSAEVPARVTTDIRLGVVSMPHGWGRKLFHPEIQTDIEVHGVSDNLLTDDVELDTLTGMPIYNAIPCAVRKADH